MSKTIIIAKNGEDEIITVKEINVPEAGGGYTTWVPEDEAGQYGNLEQLSVIENGTYNAQADGYDGYSSAVVNVPTATIKNESQFILANDIGEKTYNAADYGYAGLSEIVVGMDITGKTTYSKSGKTGDILVHMTQDANLNISLTEMPEKLEVVAIPSTYIYSNGQQVDYSGIIVRAMYNSGLNWGIVANNSADGLVPYNQLTFSRSTALKYGISITMDGYTYVAYPCAHCSYVYRFSDPSSNDAYYAHRIQRTNSPGSSWYESGYFGGRSYGIKYKYTVTTSSSGTTVVHHYKGLFLFSDESFVEESSDYSYTILDPTDDSIYTVQNSDYSERSGAPIVAYENYNLSYSTYDGQGSTTIEILNDFSEVDFGDQAQNFNPKSYLISAAQAILYNMQDTNAPKVIWHRPYDNQAIEATFTIDAQ